MKKQLFLISIILMVKCLFAQTSNIKGIDLDLQVEDHVAEPKVFLIIKNMTNETINIPEIMIRNNYMSYNYFQFRPEFEQLKDITPEYKGVYQTFSAEDLKRIKKLNPNKTLRIEYNITDFYLLKDEMYSAQMIRYMGPLGSTDYRLLYFESNGNSTDFKITMEIRNDNGLWYANLKYKYIGNAVRYYANSFFSNTENIANDYFYVEINGLKIPYNYIVGDSFGRKNILSNLRKCIPGEIVETKVLLNNFYDIPEEVKSYKIIYKGILGSVIKEEVIND